MTDQNSSLLELEFDDMTSGLLNEAAKWSRYIVITFYICCGLLVIASMGVFMAGEAITETITTSFGEAGSLGLAIIVIILLVVTLIIGALAYLLGRFSSRVKLGIQQNNQQIIAEGVRGLKNYLTITGVFGMIGLLGSLIELFTILAK